MANSTGPGDPLFDDPAAFLFTDGSALPTGSAGWGVHITFAIGADTRAIWGPVSTFSFWPQFAWCPESHEQYRGTQCHIPRPRLDPEAAQVPGSGNLPVLQHRHRQLL